MAAKSAKSPTPPPDESDLDDDNIASSQFKSKGKSKIRRSSEKRETTQCTQGSLDGAKENQVFEYLKEHEACGITNTVTGIRENMCRMPCGIIATVNNQNIR